MKAFFTLWMNKWLRFLCITTLFASSHSAFAWNACGHRLIAAIAWDQLTTKSQQKLQKYNVAFDQDSKYQSVIEAATWLDDIRNQEVTLFNPLHYSDTYFSLDQSPLPQTSPYDAVWAITNAAQIVESAKSTDFQKGLALRILLHTVGDIHQPLHTANKVSIDYPNGDAGGNHFSLAPNSIAKNLHGYWDRGGGLLTTHWNAEQIMIFAKEIEKQYPCQTMLNKNETAKKWAQEGFTLAVSVAYQLQRNEYPNWKYQKQVQEVTRRQIALAGCRLGKMLSNF